MINPWLGMVGTMVALGTIFAALKAWQAKSSPHPEATRKLMHVGMGLVVICFPWVFRERWPVVLMTLGSVGLFAAIRAVPALKKSAGSVVGGVQRASMGEIYYPISVGILFWIYEGGPAMFLVPMLILTLADAVAALVGLGYGRKVYDATDGRKSAEGSTAFFMVAFLSAHVPLLLMTDTGRPECLLIAFMLGLLVMIIEAFSWRGLDNLFIPLGAYGLLQIYMKLPADQLLVRSALTTAMVIFVLLLKNRSWMNPAALLGTVLFGYGAWALGGWIWVLPPLTLFIASLTSGPRKSPPDQDIIVVFQVTAPGLFWMIAQARTGRFELLAPFAIAFAIHTAFVGIYRLDPTLDKLAWRRRFWMIAAKGWILALAPAIVFTQIRHHPFTVGQMLYILGMGFAGVALASIAFHKTLPWLLDKSSNTHRHLHVVGSLYAIAGSLLGLTWGN